MILFFQTTEKLKVFLSCRNDKSFKKAIELLKGGKVDSAN